MSKGVFFKCLLSPIAEQGFPPFLKPSFSPLLMFLKERSDEVCMSSVMYVLNTDEEIKKRGLLQTHTLSIVLPFPSRADGAQV